MNPIIDFFTTTAVDTLAVIATGILYLITSILSFFQYQTDKRIAKRNSTRLKQKSRVSEKSMHILEAIGGWPGALIEQRVVNHKKEKRPYMFVFWIIVLLHIVLWGLYITGDFILDLWSDSATVGSLFS